MATTDETILFSPQTEVPAVPEKRKKKRSGAFGRFLRRTLLLLVTLALLTVGGAALLLNTLFNGPSETARDMLTLRLSEKASTEWIPGIFLGEETVAQILSKPSVIPNQEG